jgi:hypothetical protein
MKTTLHDRAESRNKNQSRSTQKKLAKPFSRPRKRLRELVRNISRRHGGCVPDTDDADVYLEPVVNCFRLIVASRARDVSVDGVLKLFWFWCEDGRAPHVSRSHATDLVRRELAGPPCLIPDDVVGKAIRLSYAERLQDKITTIGSYDVGPAMRKKLAKERRRDRDRRSKAEKRKANGATPHANSLSQTKPWEAEGISRSTYDRRRKKAAAQAGAGDENSSPHQRNEVDESSSAHRPSYSRPTNFGHVTEQSPASMSGAPQARPLQHDGVEIGVSRVALEARPAPPPPRPIVVQIDSVPDGLVVDQDGVEFKPPPPHQRRPAPKDWMSVAMAGLNRGRS